LLTVDYDRLDVRPGMRVLDLGCGEGRHTFEAYRRGADVVALDLSEKDLATTRSWCAAMELAGEVPPTASATTVQGDLLCLPFPDASFDRIIASEVLEHIPDDVTAIREMTRVLRPGGLAAVTVPRWLPERVCWALSDEYHANEGGHVRIYKEDELSDRLRAAGLTVTGNDFAHALHSPYWWLKCAIGDAGLTKAYHRMLVWDITEKPALTRVLEQALNPLIGKSVAIYLKKEEVTVGVGA
jgi:SAM-dependent methyltransferase